MIRSAGADCGIRRGRDHLRARGRLGAGSWRGDGARIGADGIEEDDVAEAPRPARRVMRALPETTGDPPPFCSSILIASSGVGMSAT